MSSSWFPVLKLLRLNRIHGPYSSIHYPKKTYYYSFGSTLSILTTIHEDAGINIEVSISTWTLEKESQVVLGTSPTPKHFGDGSTSTYSSALHSLLCQHWIPLFVCVWFFHLCKLHQAFVKLTTLLHQDPYLEHSLVFLILNENMRSGKLLILKF